MTAFPPPPDGAVFRPRGVLVVDDTEVVRSSLGIGLGASGFAVWLASSGREGVALYRAHRTAIDVVLLDVRMPDWDGPATLAAIRDAENVIARELDGLTAGTSERHLLLDFSHVGYLNSVELGTFVTLHKKARAAGGRLTLFNLSAQVFKLFSVSRLDTLLEICREDADAHSGPPPSATDGPR
jgi:anti-anti-sigma factor